MTASTLATLQRSRVTSTSVEGFDHIIGLTQGTINEQLKEAWKNDERLQNFNVVSQDENGDLNAIADAPTVQIQLGTEQNDVIFYLNLTSGTWGWWDGVGRKAQFVTEEFSNWRLAFRVKPTLRPAQESDVIPERIQASLANYGEHTVNLLVLGLTALNNPEYVESLSSLPDANDSEEKHERKKELLTTYMHSYLRRRKDSKRPQVVLGYMPELTNVAEKHKLSASVFPTSLAIQGYPYIANLAKTQDQVSDLYSENPEALEIAKNNLLLITGMASNRAFPKSSLIPTASWAAPTEEGKLANPTVVLSRQSFLEGYLLPRLIDINKASAVRAISTECRMNGLLGYRAEFDIQYGSDKAKDPETSYNWNLTSQSSPPNEASVVLNGALPSYGYTVASSPCLVWDWKLTNTQRDDDGYKSKLTCTTNNWLVIPKGTRSDKCSIYICGKSTVEASTEVSFLDRGSMKINGTWATEIKLSTSPNGGIIVSVETGKAEVKSTHSGTPYEEPERGIKKRLTGVIEGLPTKIKPLANMPINRWQFFIPATGDFSFKNPTFNYNGDLLLDLVQNQA